MEPTRGVRPVTRLGCWLTGPLVMSGGSPALGRVSDLAVAAEQQGFDSFWVTDEEAPLPSGTDAQLSFEAYSLLGALAARTTVLHLGAVPLHGERRAPSMVAKIVTGIDVISHGRGILTVAMDGQGEGRGLAGADALRVGRSMLTEEVPTVSGSVYRVKDAFNRPRPVQIGGVPLVALLGGGRSVSSDPVSTGSFSSESWAAVASLADAVLVPGGPDEVGAAKTAMRTAASAGGGATNEPMDVQVIGMVTAVGAATRSAEWTTGDLPRHRLDPQVVDSARSLFEAGADGCLIPVDVYTSPDEISRIGDAMRDMPLARDQPSTGPIGGAGNSVGQGEER